MGGAKYWYVRARSTRSGEEFQRIAPTKPGLSGGHAAAVAGMKAHLLQNGVTPDDIEDWKIVEVHEVDVMSRS
ncbi:MAG TPA: hypothetical protein VGT40_17600 [Methylomirabilota bacterium]|nr:hypothetical protein [Methylomirabilota bacterium]